MENEDQPVHLRVIPRPTSGIPNEERAFQIYPRHIQIIIIQELPPHPQPRLAVLITFSRRIDTQRHVQIIYNSCNFLFKIVIALRLRSPLLQADLFLV